MTRWQQRFQSYQTALQQLENAVALYGDTELDIIKEGIIQRFEFTHELAWKLLKDILEEAGQQDVLGSRIATRMAFNQGLITEGELWLAMIATRNLTVRTYNYEILSQEYNKIIHQYSPLFIQLRERVQTLWQNLD